MKKTILILLMVIPISIFAQTYTLNVDTVQNFKHDTLLSTTEASLLNKMTYLDGGVSNITFVFDLDKNVMTWQRGSDKFYLKILKKIYSSNSLMEVWVKYNNDTVNYLLTINKDNPDKYVLMSREFVGDKVVGWFDPTVEIKKRP
jgi:hypothetical protein